MGKKKERGSNKWEEICFLCIYWNQTAYKATDGFETLVIITCSALESSFGAGVLGDSFSALRHGVFRQLPGQQQPHCGLHLPAGDGGAFIVLSQPGRLCGNPLKQVIHEGVHDAHGSAWNPRVRMNLLKAEGSGC